MNIRMTVTDLNTGDVYVYNFGIIVKPQTPGYTASVSPISTQVAQGDCQEYTVDITSRFGYERDVLINLVWTSAPPSGDVTFEWKTSPYIIQHISDTSVNVRTRQNMTTRYFFTACTTSSTSLGTYYLRAVFISGSIIRNVDLTFQVIRQPSTFLITPIPAVNKVVPGGTATYQVKIESLNGYVGYVNLSLDSIPQTTDVIKFMATNPLGFLPDNYVELTLSDPVAYADLELQTYASYYNSSGVLVKGTPSGMFYVKVTGEGDGFDYDGNPTTPTSYGLAGLQIFSQIDEMKTPSLDLKGMVLLLMGILGTTIVAVKRADSKNHFKI